MLLPTVSAVTVGAMTVGVAFAVTGTSDPVPSHPNPLRAVGESGFAPADLPGAPGTDAGTDTGTDTGPETGAALTPSPAVATAIADAVRTSPLTAGVAATDYQVANSRLAG
nr:hypothetical protein [Micromonospora sp. DSM 115978]